MGQKGQKGQNRVGRIILVDPVLFLEYFIAVLRFAFAFPFELAVALPDNTAVAVGGVPGFGSENIAAVSADDLPGERAGLMVPVAAVFAPFQFHLNLLPFPRLDDGGMPSSKFRFTRHFWFSLAERLSSWA